VSQCNNSRVLGKSKVFLFIDTIEYASLQPEAAIELIRNEMRVYGTTSSMPTQSQGDLANMIAGLAAQAQAQGRALDPNTIAALASMANTSTPSFMPPDSTRFNSFQQSFNPMSMNSMSSMNNMSVHSMNPMMANPMMTNNAMMTNTSMMNNRSMQQQTPNMLTMMSNNPTTHSSNQNNYTTSMMSNLNTTTHTGGYSHAIPQNSAASSESVSNILNRLKSLAEMQKQNK
jgi:hypothetical protein